MKKSSSNPQRTTPLLTRRGLVFMGVQAGVVGVLTWRLRQLGVDQSKEFLLLAEENRVGIRLLQPPRGLIYDRTGEAVAANLPNYKITIVREQADDPQMVLQRLAGIIPLSENDIDRCLKEMSQLRAFISVTVAENLKWEHIAAVSANAPALPGVQAEVGLNRFYPKGLDFAHIVGYVGPVSDYDLSLLDDPDPLLQTPRFQIGKNGVENREDLALRGNAGVKRIEVNAHGRIMRELNREEAEPGDNIQLTIDHKLQSFVATRLGSESAAAVIMDVQNGDLLAMASSPSFDPNLFVNGISMKDWKGLNENKYRPLANKTVSGTYPPGSTFKMVVALAALESGISSPGNTVFCPGHFDLGSHRFHCWKRGGHGHMNMKNSLKQSCDVYYYETARRVGIERISAMANKLGLGIKPDLPLPAVRRGLAPTKAWKQEVKGQDWRIGDTINSAIGQGFVLASPMQLAIMVARIASGNSVSPRLVSTVNEKPTPFAGGMPLEIDPVNLAIVRQGMNAVSNEPGGTAYRSRIPKKGMHIAGKTGTSQVRRITKAERAAGVTRNRDLPWERRDHALFVGFAPYDNPRYSVSVVVEHGGGGSKAAAPIAKDIMLSALTTIDPNYGKIPGAAHNPLKPTSDGDSET